MNVFDVRTLVMVGRRVSSGEQLRQLRHLFVGRFISRMRALHDLLKTVVKRQFSLAQHCHDRRPFYHRAPAVLARGDGVLLSEQIGDHRTGELFGKLGKTFDIFDDVGGVSLGLVEKVSEVFDLLIRSPVTGATCGIVEFGVDSEFVYRSRSLRLKTTLVAGRIFRFLIAPALALGGIGGSGGHRSSPFGVCKVVGC